MRRTQLSLVWFWRLFCIFCLLNLWMPPGPVRAVDNIIPCAAEPTNMILNFGQFVSCAVDAPGDTDLFRFAGNSGEVVIVQMTYQSGDLRPCVELIAPDASRITACSNAFDNRIDTTLSQTGTYTILTDVLVAGTTGGYSLALERLIAASPNAAGVQFGNLYPDSLDLAGDLDLFTFVGEANTTIRIQGTYVSGAMRPCVMLIAPDNSRLSACENSFANTIDTTLTQSGPYAILFTSMVSTTTGGYALAVERLRPPSPNALPIGYGTVAAGEISPTGDIDLFRFEGKSATSIRVQVTYLSGAIRPCLELIFPDNTRSSACENAFSNTVNANLDQAGTYAVLVTGLVPTTTGAYHLELQCLVGTCEDQFPLYLPLIRR